MNGPGDPRSVVVPEGGLLRLVETEARLAQALVAAEHEAAAVVRVAREEATEQSARLQVRIDLEVGVLAERIAAERDAEMQRITDATDVRCRRLRDLSDETVDRLAAAMAARVLDLPEPRS